MSSFSLLKRSSRKSAINQLTRGFPRVNLVRNYGEDFLEDCLINIMYSIRIDSKIKLSFFYYYLERCMFHKNNYILITFFEKKLREYIFHYVEETESVM